MCGQCTRTCSGGIQFRSVTCVGGRACVLDEKPAEDRPCNSRPCLSADSDDVTPTQAPANSTAARDDVTTVTIATATAKTSTVTASSAAAPQATTTTTTTATTTPASTATSTTTITQPATTARRSVARYRWMALFWDEVHVPFHSFRLTVFRRFHS